MKSVTFCTKDKVDIVANYWKGGRRGVVLLHMMPATKESWDRFGGQLFDAGFSVLAIDLRGHGESIFQEGKKLDYKIFTDQEHQASIEDVEASVSFLKNVGVKEIFLVGASIGANLSLVYQSEHPQIQKAILLSPGTNYYGVRTQPSAQALQNNQEVYLVAGVLDQRKTGNAADMAKLIAEKIPGKKEIKIYSSSAHGTDLFAEDPQLMNTLIIWLQK
ncbi:alpha/beta hydrolase [Candidatus Woesearchaeota archaeon]|nr:alpha/beta hydrolase [Candidatus Woesearchaeota archaeon]